MTSLPEEKHFNLQGKCLEVPHSPIPVMNVKVQNDFLNVKFLKLEKETNEKFWNTKSISKKIEEVGQS